MPHYSHLLFRHAEYLLELSPRLPICVFLQQMPTFSAHIVVIMPPDIEKVELEHLFPQEAPYAFSS